MRVFVTGATGFIGQAVVKELLSAGHQVLALARSDDSAKKLEAAGVEVQRGSLEDLESLQKAAAGVDGVIHLAFIHDFTNYVSSCATDRKAIEAIGATLAGTNRPFVITSGTLLLPHGRLATERDSPQPNDHAPRGASEQVALSLASQGVRVSIVRLPPSVHGEGDPQFVPTLIKIAREKQAAAYVGEGLNRWPAVHRLDAARLYRLALEKAPAGSVLHGVADEGVAIRDLATVIAEKLNVPVVSKPPGAEASEYFSWLTWFISGDNPTSSALTQELLGWHPTEATLLDDVKENYFKAS